KKARLQKPQLRNKKRMAEGRRENIFFSSPRWSCMTLLYHPFGCWPREGLEMHNDREWGFCVGWLLGSRSPRQKRRNIIIDKPSLVQNSQCLAPGKKRDKSPGILQVLRKNPYDFCATLQLVLFSHDCCETCLCGHPFPQDHGVLF